MATQVEGAGLPPRTYEVIHQALASMSRKASIGVIPTQSANQAPGAHPVATTTNE